MSSTFALVLLCWAFPFRQLGVVGLLAPALRSKSWFPAQMLNGQQVSCSSCREGKRGCFRKDSEMQAEKSFRKSKKEKEEKSYHDRVWRQWKDDARARSCLFSRCQAESQGSDWPVLLTCPGSRDASPALEGDKVCEMQCGDVQFWNVTSTLRGSLCVTGRTQVTQRQELVAAGSTGHSWCWPYTPVFLLCLLVGSWEHLEELGRIRDPWMSVLQRCLCAKAESRDWVGAPSPPHSQIFH